MLTISKKNGAVSTAGSTAKKGDKGRLELSAERRGDNYGVRFMDYGNYGRIRWEADFGDLTADQLDAMIDSLIELREGETESTQVEFSPPAPEAEVEAEPAAEPEATEEPEVPAAALEGTEETDQLEA